MLLGSEHYCQVLTNISGPPIQVSIFICFTVQVFRVHHSSTPQLLTSRLFSTITRHQAECSKANNILNLLLRPDNSRTYNTLHKRISTVSNKSYKKKHAEITFQFCFIKTANLGSLIFEDLQLKTLMKYQKALKHSP